MNKIEHFCSASLFALAATVILANQEIGIEVANGDFEVAENEGSIRSNSVLGIIGHGVEMSPIGKGPWSGESTAIMGIILPPNIVIASNDSGNGYCEVSGLTSVAVDIGNAIRNSAAVKQQLTSTYESYTTYVLEVDIDSFSALSLELLASQGIGAELLADEETIASSEQVESFLKLSLISGSAYRLTVTYKVLTSVPKGNIGIRLFAGKSLGLVSASVLPSVRFDNVTLTAIYLES
jgi:hypothetical protein